MIKVRGCDILLADLKTSFFDPTLQVDPCRCGYTGLPPSQCTCEACEYWNTELVPDYQVEHYPNSIRGTIRTVYVNCFRILSNRGNLVLSGDNLNPTFSIPSDPHNPIASIGPPISGQALVVAVPPSTTQSQHLSSCLGLLQAQLSKLGPLNSKPNQINVTEDNSTSGDSNLISVATNSSGVILPAQLPPLFYSGDFKTTRTARTLIIPLSPGTSESLTTRCVSALHAAHSVLLVELSDRQVRAEY